MSQRVLMLPHGTGSVLTCAGNWPQHRTVGTLGPPPWPLQTGGQGRPGGPRGVNPPIRIPIPICPQEVSPLPHSTPWPGPIPIRPRLSPSEGLTMGRACRLLPRPHICRGKAGDKMETGTPWHAAGPAQPHTGHGAATQTRRWAWHSTAHHPLHGHGSPSPLGLTAPDHPHSPGAKHSSQAWHVTARHGMAWHGTAQYSTARNDTARYSTARHDTAGTHPPQLRVPPGCPVGPHLPWPRRRPQVRPPHPRPAALWGRGTGQPGPSLAAAWAARGHPRRDVTSLVQEPGPGVGHSSPRARKGHGAGLTPQAPWAVLRGHTSPFLCTRGCIAEHEVAEGSARPRAGRPGQSHVPPGHGSACPSTGTCLELDGPQHLRHIVHVDGEVVHVFVAGLRAAAH